LLQQPDLKLLNVMLLQTGLAGGVLKKLPKFMFLQQHKLAKYSKLPV
jgi:hypothetical protein